MIGKLTKGADFAGLAAYLTRPDADAKILEMRNLSADSPQAAAAEMQMAALVSVRTQKPVLHLSVRAAEGDRRLTDSEMREDAGSILEALDLQDHQAVIVRHGDDHYHMMINRVGPDGRAVTDSHSYARVEAQLRRIEQERGLTVVHGRNAPAADDQRMNGNRTSTDPRQHTAPDSVKQTLLTAKSWDELHTGLKRDGWRMERVQKPNQKAGAVLVGPQGERIAAGRLDRQATLANITARIDGPQQVAGPNATSPAASPAGRKMSAAHRLPGMSGGGKKMKRRGVKSSADESMQMIGATLGSLTVGGAGMAHKLGAGRRRPGQISKTTRPGLGL